MKRALSILFAVVLALSFSLMATPVAAGTITVGPGGPPTYDYATIQAAVSAASSGDTIMVAAGTYGESVVVSKDNISIISTTAHGAVVDPPGAGNCFSVDANYVTVDGFELTGVTGGYGIGFSGSHNTFQNNTIHNINSGGTGGGICCWDTGTKGPSNYNTISNNIIYDVTADGILTGCCRTDAVMEGNVITGNTIYNFATQDGWNPAIEEVNGKNYIISNNVITGSTQYYGILHTSWNGIPQSGNTISGNTISGLTTYGAAICMMADTGEGSGFGGVIHGFTAPSEVYVGDSTIEDNTLYGNVHGIDLYALGGATTKATITGIEIQDNNIYDNSQNGIYLITRYSTDSVKDNTIEGNTLTGNNVGAKVRAYVAGGSLTGNIFHYNNIYGNTQYGLQNLSNPTALIDARYNWWGNNSGPYNASLNPSGAGNAVSDNVDFQPWTCETAPSTGGTASFTPDAGSITGLTAVPTPPGTPVALPHGMFSFTVTGITGQVTITIELPGAVPVGTKWWKYQSGGWYSLPIGDDNGDNIITITLTDNAFPDDADATVGVILDDGGPGNPGPVGWETYPVNKVRVLLPWIALFAALIVGATLFLLRRRRAQS